MRRKCLLKLVIQENEGVRIEVKGRRGIRSKQLLVDRKDMIGNRKLEEETLDHIIWRTRPKSGNEPVLTLNLLTTTIVAPPSNASKWQMGFN